MARPRFTDADFHAALWGLMPRGRAWNRDPGSVQDAVLRGLAPTFARSSDAALALLIDAFPATTIDLMPEWEATLGLPDPCSGVPTSEADARRQILARLTNAGGQSIPTFIHLAKQLGYPDAWIEQVMAFNAESPCTHALATDPWCFVWVLHVVQLPPGNEAIDRTLECLVHRYAPAHTFVRIVYAPQFYVLPAYVEPGYIEGDV